MGGGACVPQDAVEQGGAAPPMAPSMSNEGHHHMAMVQLHGSLVLMDDGLT
ncbi:hypothetical protein TanjilG_22331 [Lupinus angustifolius]|uniref:Uncharacterized protein n=1 Tax=Lupinus angustifolius TaxID=3871 RepID=A0A1J7HYT5_LUPAN|nr:hypothetical protein TanjilG_22331 [Lupinus angustifolius]